MIGADAALARWPRSPRGQRPEPRNGGASRRGISAAARDLRNEALREVLDLRLEGLTREEIAKQMGCTERAVKRKLDVIREAWLQGES